MTDAVVYVVMGVTAAGKTTLGEHLSKALKMPFIEGDELHPESNVAKMAAGVPLTDEDRWPWFANIAAAVNQIQGPAIVSCSALKRAYRDYLRSALTGPVKYLWLNPDKEALEQRLLARQDHFMPASLLNSQLETLETPLSEKDVIDVTGRSVSEICAELELMA